jgi:hypothetical protein
MQQVRGVDRDRHGRPVRLLAARRFTRWLAWYAANGLAGVADLVRANVQFVPIARLGRATASPVFRT